jgi:chain length determinant protein (polysaccharide antigen chain regulator)
MNEESRNSALAPQYADDEINLFDLWMVLVRQWKVIGTVTGMTVLGAAAYVLLATPVYETQAVVRPPESKHVEVLNIPGIREVSSAMSSGSPISQISSADIFAKFIGNLKSSSLRQRFFAENPQFSSLHQQFVGKNPQYLRDNLPKSKEGTKGEAGLVFLSLQGHDSKLIADWLNGFILLVEKETIDDYFGGVETKIASQEKAIKNQLQTAQELAGQRRLDRIALLEEQIAIARAAKIFERKSANYSTVESQRIGETLSTTSESLYMRGVKELTAEKEELEKRKFDEPFITGFRDKQESLAQLAAGLKQLQAARANARAVTVDQPAIEAKRPVKPRRMLVLALGVVLGGMIGVFAAFVVNFGQEQKAKTKE